LQQVQYRFGASLSTTGKTIFAYRRRIFCAVLSFVGPVTPLQAGAVSSRRFKKINDATQLVPLLINYFLFRAKCENRFEGKYDKCGVEMYIVIAYNRFIYTNAVSGGITGRNVTMSRQ
jgi:hypothetical protein